MNHASRWGGALAVAGLMAAGAAHAGSVTNTMTNIVTVTDSCDVVAVGVDFGITTATIPAGGINAVVTPNTAAGNTVTGNTANPDAGADGGAGNDDVLSLTTPDALLNAAISPILSAIGTTLPGLYVACTTSPTTISLISAAAGAASFPLPVALGGSPVGTYSGQMVGIGGGAGAGNSIDYQLTFVGVPASVDTGLGVSLFTAAFLATGSIPAAQTGTIVPGYYSDVATAQVDF